MGAAIARFGAKRAAFISFEGLDGSGKSVHARLAADRLEARGLDVVRTREPGGSEGAEAVRAILSSGGVERWDPVAETFLISAARADHCRRIIGPALERGSWVVSDRFVDSMFAYQGAGRAVSDSLLRTVAAHSVSDLMPDLTLVCDVDVETALERIVERSREGVPLARYELTDRDLRECIRQGFLDGASLASERCVVVDTSPPLEMVAARIWAVIEGRLDVPDGPN